MMNLDMSFSQVHHMNIVSIPGPVPRLVIVAVHRDLLSATDRHLRHGDDDGKDEGGDDENEPGRYMALGCWGSQGGPLRCPRTHEHQQD